VAFKVKPRDELFFGCFEGSAEAIRAAARILHDYVEQDGDPVPKLELLSEVEEKGDQLFGRIVDRLNNSFVTPFEREDIYNLAKELNRVIDHIHGTMEKIVIYKTGTPRWKAINDLVKVLVAAGDEIRDAVVCLRTLKESYDVINRACDRIRELEHEGDRLYRQGVATLFEQATDAIEIIKWKEVYEHLETTLDYCEDVSNVLKGFSVKYV
jgi:uncharacterized protein Yka (UPF0111/DUF47 family)